MCNRSTPIHFCFFKKFAENINFQIQSTIELPKETPLSRVMIVNPISVTLDMGINELEQTFDRYVFSGLPVVNDSGAIVGVLQRADLEEAHGEQADRRFMKFSGIVGGDELRSAPLVSRSLSRLRSVTGCSRC